jgi:hypothetical protein
MIGLILAIIIAYLIFSVFFCLVLETECYFITDLTPSNLYKDTSMNKVGCWIVCILCFILGGAAWVWKFIYWIFHVGRKEN